MKLRLLFIASMVVTMALVLAGALKDLATTRAAMPLPVQPFATKGLGGVNTTQLGQKITQNQTFTQVLRGERNMGSWIFSGPGFSVDLDKNLAEGSNAGTIWADIDVNCDGGTDFLYQDCVTHTPLNWVEATTAVQGTDDAYLIPIMPPYSWLVRHEAPMNHVCIGSAGAQATSISVLNTIYTTIPFSPNSGAGVAYTMLGGAPDGPPSLICLDSPSNSESITSFVNNPVPQGNFDGPCNTAANQCADVGIYGMWTRNSVQLLGPLWPAVTQVIVEKHKVNNGPEEGQFWEHWDVESTNPNIVATWDISGTPIFDQPMLIPPFVPVDQGMPLNISCNAPGWGLLILKNILSPMPPTKDTYLDDNAFTFVVQVTCGAMPGDPLVDKEVAFIRTTPDHLPLAPGGAAVVQIDELKENHATTVQPGREWLVAEPAEGIYAEWLPGVTVDDGLGGHTQTPVVTNCTASDPDGDACITFEVNEWVGQADVHAQLNVICDPAIPIGFYPVVIKAIDLPTAGFESKPSDNAQRKVISVWCGGEAPDSQEDANGLYPRWTVYSSVGQSQFGAAGDIRKPYKNPPSIASDIGYVERILQLDCYWIDDDGCALGTCDGSVPGRPANGYIDAEESWNDPDLLALGGINAVDADRDCLAAPAFAQPGHPVDPVPANTGTLCPAVIYSENPVSVVYDTAADSDCDGLPDGVEKAWGSNLLLPDSDADGAADFVEMFKFTTPVNPDTDNDGFKDAPAGVYGDNTNVDVDNCPSVYNPTQLNTDGHRRDNGPKIAGTWASNSNQDKLGDACDNDNDNDGAIDGYETGKGTGVYNLDTDGDTVNDGAELRLLESADPNADPLNPAKKPAWSNVQQVYYRGCHINVADTAYPAFAEQDTTNDDVENDLDGDGTNCPGDADSDSGAPTHANKPEVLDKYEAYGYNTQIGRADTDGDGCEDWVEIHDINGDRTVDSGDTGTMNKRVAGKVTSDCTGTYPICAAGTGISDRIFDVNKDGFIDAGDSGQLNKNTCLLKPWGGCPTCPAEN